MRYAPKHAKPAAPAALKTDADTAPGSRRGLLAIGEPRKGRHSSAAVTAATGHRGGMRSAKAKAA
jgi:hypothetical protein